MRTIFQALLILVFCTASGALASSPLRVAEHTPGYYLNLEAQRSYEKGWYFDARHNFKAAAFWADKLAQFNLGIIYHRGDGVERDPARAWAWFALAAERKYPAFVDIWKAVWDELDEDERERANLILAELEPKYSDRVAIDRTANRMEREYRRARRKTGFMLNVTDRFGRMRSKGDFYSPEKWDFHHVIEFETRLFQAVARGRVTLGEFDVIEEEAQPDDGKNNP